MTGRVSPPSAPSDPAASSTAAASNERPWLVGILNVTTDSFAGDGVGGHLDAALRRAEAMLDAGAEILDVGAESSRPGATEVPEGLEAERIARTVEALRGRFDAPIAVDTRRPTTARVALDAGARMVNDTSGAPSAEMAAHVRDADALWVLMHVPHRIGAMGWSAAAAEMPTDRDAGVARVVTELAAMAQQAEALGVAGHRLVLDPGIGFGKSAAQNLVFLRPVEALARLGRPLYVGPSRKSVLGVVTGRPVGERLMATAAAVTAAVLAGARYVRVHDVAEMRDVVDVAWAIHQGDATPVAGGRRCRILR